ncbi:hypothetical protein IID19_03975 [Patescibacteria group bacterium]|nr:hypothetical protein [Patescibacteria group bacterium]
MAKQNKLQQIKKLVETAHVSLESARSLLLQVVGKDDDSLEVIDKAKEIGSVSTGPGEKIIEGVFDGQNMIGPDGKQYSVPANYASKSKLVLGDTLKLTITSDGTFMYKQIGPVERERLVGMLAKDDTTDEYRVVVGDKSYKVLLASVTYFKGEPGDEVVLLIPKGKECVWGAVENIIRESVEDSEGGKVAAGPTPLIADTPSEKVEDIDDLG